MAIEVFNRYEKKYMIDRSTLEAIQRRLSDYMETDAFNQNGSYYTIANLYYDTIDNELIRKSISKPVFKEKLRLRSYGVPQSDAKVYLEIKKKVNGIVNKRRSGMKLEEAYQFLQNGKAPEFKPYMNRQVLGEIEYFLHKYQLKPAVYLAYDRQAYFAHGNKGLRISFDTNIRTRRTELELEAGEHGRLLLDEGKVLMEIKTGGSIPLWLVHLLSEYKIYPSNFSKYGTEYVQMMIGKMKETQSIIETPAEICTNPKVLKPSFA